MKLKNVIVASLVATSGYAFADTSVSVLNFVNSDVPNSLILRDNAGNLIDNGAGSFAAGYFSTLADDSFRSFEDFQPIKDDFQTFISGTTIFGSPTVDGLFNQTATGGTVNAASPFLNQTIYILLGNAATIAESTELAIYKSGEDFSEETGGAGSETVNILGPIDRNGNLLLGEAGDAETVGTFTFNESIVLASTIPEPSTGLLSLIAGLGLLARRRR